MVSLSTFASLNPWPYELRIGNHFAVAALRPNLQRNRDLRRETPAEVAFDHGDWGPQPPRASGAPGGGRSP